MNRVFISYARQDIDAVEDLDRELETYGFKVWRDEKKIKVGESIVGSVEGGIQASDYFCLVLSSNSINRPWVVREYQTAVNLQLASEKKPIILPILLDHCDIPIFLRDIRYADFRVSFKEGLSQLLHSMSKGDQSQTPYSSLILFIEKHFGSVSNLLSTIRQHENLVFYTGISGGPICAKNGLCELDWQHAVDIRVAVRNGVIDTYKELKDLLKKETRLRLLTSSKVPSNDWRTRYVAVTPSVGFTTIAELDDITDSLDYGLLTLMETIERLREDIYQRKVYVLPKFTSWEGQGISLLEPYDFEDNIEVSDILEEIEGFSDQKT